MIDERMTNALGKTNKKFSLYVMILSVISIIFKTIIYQEFIILDSLTELVVIISLIVTLITRPMEDFIDERVEKNINNHYSKAFKIILPITLLTYLFSLIIMLKFNSRLSIKIPPNLFVNAVLLLVFIGIVYLNKKHHIYLNNKFIDKNKEEYINGVLARIGKIFIIVLSLTLITFILDLLIPGDKVTVRILIILLVSALNISIQYILYSVYEYNHAKERLLLDNGYRFHVTRNMFLYFSIYSFFYILIVLKDIFSLQFALSLISSESFKLEYLYIIFSNADFIFQIYLLVFSFIIYFSLKNTLSNNNKKNKKIFKISFILLCIKSGFRIFSMIYKYLSILFVKPNQDYKIFEIINYVNIFIKIILYIYFIILLIYIAISMYKYKLKGSIKLFILTITSIILNVTSLVLINIRDLSKIKLLNLSLIFSYLNIGFLLVVFLYIIYIINIYKKAFMVKNEEIYFITV